ncbi:hypothetical protein BSKO_01105 [Bryopsis sp. KO-2023]|nr:hypothetical protein BSKO_01105 [Bryopsis sp. KO-2023]
MFAWLTGRRKEQDIEDYLRALERAKKPAHVTKILTAIGDLVEKDDVACVQLCSSKLMVFLENFQQPELLWESCSLLDTVARRATLNGRWQLGRSGAVRYLVTAIKTNNVAKEEFANFNGQIISTACTALEVLCSEHRTRKAAKSLGIVKTLLDIFQKRLLEADQMRNVLDALKEIIDLESDSIADLSLCIPKLLHVLLNCVHGDGVVATEEQNDHVSLVCDLICFLAGSQELAKLIIVRGGLHSLVDMIPESIEASFPTYMAGVMKAFVAIWDKESQGSSGLLPRGTVEKMRGILSEALEKSIEFLTKVGSGKAVGTMHVAWRAGVAICAVSGTKEAEDLKGLRLLFNLMRSDYSRHLLRYGYVSRDEMCWMKERLLKTIDAMTRKKEYHEAIDACGGANALQFVLDSVVQEKIKDIARRALRNMREPENSTMRFSLTSDNPLFEQQSHHRPAGITTPQTLSPLPVMQVVGVNQQHHAGNLGIANGHNAPEFTPENVGQKRRNNAISNLDKGEEPSVGSRVKRFRRGPLFTSAPIDGLSGLGWDAKQE